MAKAFDRDVDEPVVRAIQKVAEARGVAMARVALAWVLSEPVVSCPVVGPTKPHHLQDAVAALEVRLTGEEIAELEAPLPTAGQLLVVITTPGCEVGRPTIRDLFAGSSPTSIGVGSCAPVWAHCDR